MAHALKTDQNTPVNDINTLTNPNTKTLIDRYVFASNWCKGKTVLDCACGWGYGSKILEALGATWCEGYDIDKHSVSWANEQYNPINSDMNSFRVMDVTIPWMNVDNKNKKDVIVSIETFEHVPRETVTQMLSNFKNSCIKNGTIIITTPQRRTPEFNYIEGSTHLYEYTVNEFYDELSKVFSNIELWYAVEFRHPASQELNTVFTKDPQWANQAAVMIAVITND